MFLLNRVHGGYPWLSRDSLGTQAFPVYAVRARAECNCVWRRTGSRMLSQWPTSFWGCAQRPTLTDFWGRAQKRPPTSTHGVHTHTQLHSARARAITDRANLSSDGIFGGFLCTRAPRNRCQMLALAHAPRDYLKLVFPLRKRSKDSLVLFAEVRLTCSV